MILCHGILLLGCHEVQSEGACQISLSAGPDYEFVLFVVDVGAVWGAVLGAVKEVWLGAACDVDCVHEAVFDKGVSKAI